MKILNLSLPIIFLISVFTVNNIYAQNETTDSAETKSNEINKVQDLKDRLATKVAELVQTQKSAIFGTVISTSLTTLEVETQTKTVKIELTDDISVIDITGTKRLELEIDNIDNDDIVTIFGEYDKTIDLLKASKVIIQNQLLTKIYGEITDVDSESYALEIKTPQDKAFTIDYEKSTKSTIQKNTNESEKAGFSDLTAGQKVVVTGSLDKDDEARISASRLFIIDLNSSE